MLPLLAEIRADTPILDERSAARRTLRLEVSAYSSRDATKALIHNLSETGLLIETSANLQVAEALQVDLPHVGTTTALIVWSREQFFGCEFISPVSKAAVSAALLRAPAQPVEQPRFLPSTALDPDSDDLLFSDERTEASQAALVISLIVALFMALAFVVALLSFPFST